MIRIEELEKRVKDQKLDEIYVLYGQENYLLEMIIKKIQKLFGDRVSGINFVEIDEATLQNLVYEMQTPAFGYEKKLILVKNTGIFKREIKKKGVKFVQLRDQLLEYLEENIEEVKRQNVLVFLEESVDKGKLVSLLEQKGAIVCESGFLKPQQIIGRLKTICQAYQVKVTDSTLAYLVEMVGVNMQDLINELRKQIEYVGKEGTITNETIEQLAIKQMDSVIFDLTDQLGKRQIRQAMQVLQNLLYAKEPLQKILIMLYHHFRKIYFVKLAQKQQRSLTEVLKLKPNQMFLTTKYKMQSEYFSEIELKQILQEFIELDTKSKMGEIDLQIGLETILCHYCS